MGVEEKGVNQVDTSPERVDQEWAEIAADEGITTTSEAREGDTGTAAAAPGQGGPGQPGPDREQAAEKLGGFLRLLLGWVFRRFAPAWEVTKAETEKLGSAWAAVVCKYLPAGWLRHVPGGGASIELDAILITVEIIEPRIGRPANPEKPEPETGTGPETTAPAGPPAPQGSDLKFGNVLPEVHEVEAGK